MAKSYRAPLYPVTAVPEKPKEKPRAYSYLRFSTPEQQEGDSLRRQIAVTQAYSAELGLELDAELRFEDKGVSAFRGRNAAEGELATFLEYVQAGNVPRGSYLMVESLDRISRDNVFEALDVLNGILRAGITVAVVNGRKVFSRASVSANPMELMVVVMSFATAHEESLKKSYRTLENWKSKRVRAAAHQEAMTARGPAWLTLNAETNAWLPVPERVAVVERIFRDFLAGVGDFGVNKGVENLEHLRNLGEQVNRKLLEVERVGQNCALTQESLNRLQQPTVEKGQRVPALRFGDVRVMALLQTLCLFLLAPQGFRNKELRKHVAALLGLDLTEYTPGRMTYDLRRLCLKGLIARLPGTNRYIVTSYGLKVAFFYSKVYLRILQPGWAAMNEDDIPRPLRKAMQGLETEIEKLCNDARLQPAA